MHGSFVLPSAPGNICYSTCSWSVPPPWPQALLNPPGFSSVQFSHSVVFDSLWPHGLQHSKPPCPSPTPGVYSNSCPLSQQRHPIILSFVILFSSHLQSLLTSWSFQMSQFFTSSDQSIGISVSAAVLPMHIQDWFPLGCTGWISLLSKGLSRVFSNKASILWRPAFFTVQLSHPNMITGKTIALTRQTFVGKVYICIVLSISRSPSRVLHFLQFMSLCRYTVITQNHTLN